MRTTLYMMGLAVLVLANPTLSFQGVLGYFIGAVVGAAAVFAVLGDLAEYRWYLREGRRP